MRYYRIVITDPASGQVLTPPGFQGLLGGATYTSFVNGQSLPEAWNVELDIPVIDAGTPQGGALLRVWGISLAEISQARNLNGKNISIFGGMQRGLPLAKVQQSGLLTTGYIFQAFGNWVGTDMTLDMVIQPGVAATASQPGGTGSLDQPRNLVLNWKAGTTLAAALSSTLATAFPGVTPNIAISSALVRPSDEVGYFSTLEQLAQWVRQASLSIVRTPGYPGVSITPPQQGAVNVTDRTQAATAAPIQIRFEDLIGQPTWIEAPNIQLKAVMRADLAVGTPIIMPPALITNTAQANSSLVNQRAAFEGGFDIISLRHVGNFRAPSADAWVTVIEAAPKVIQANG